MKVSSRTLSAIAAFLLCHTAEAHIGLSTPAQPIAATTQELSFLVGHGCEGLDTYRIEVQIPEGVGGVRPLDSTFGRAAVTKDETGRVKAVTWTKSSDVLPEDTQFYKVTLRASLPNAPFAALYFPTIQTCRAPDGTEKVSAWVGTSGDHGHGLAEGSTELPAPSLVVLPPRTPGWNKYTVTQHVHDLSVFKDAQIVWAGSAAYSPSDYVSGLISQEPNTQVLEQIHPGTEIWVRY
ncbi:YcnI family protein [Cystobacter ferrugineus]|uniref:YncI copper-binding domain-containing protein n=1 Tax=Cystobacter ferrugineus TaxID=83449 RepID=A0A1L9B295_9BACT|nr:DUF1775 domain-containing protein [Cystobacter ferrugineus]OJH36395.1 hypothetical protein BON30_31970 [Cystobacter ferrugineus]